MKRAPNCLTWLAPNQTDTNKTAPKLSHLAGPEAAVGVLLEAQVGGDERGEGGVGGVADGALGGRRGVCGGGGGVGCVCGVSVVFICV